MPSITTHHLFACDVFNSLNNNIKKHFSNEKLIYTTFAQSHDYLFYYTFDLKNTKRIKNLGHYAHHNNTQDYILNIIKEIKNNHLENNEQLEYIVKMIKKPKYLKENIIVWKKTSMPYFMKDHFIKNIIIVI